MFIIRFLVKLLNIIPAYIGFAPKKLYLGKFKSILRHKGGLIIACNHRSFKDYISALLLCPFKKITVMVSAQMYDFSPVTRFFLKALGVIRVDAFTGNLTSVSEAIDVVKKGGILLIYPEGKIETCDDMFPFRMGVSLISIGANAPVLPIYHDGNFGLFRHEKMLIGDLIYPNDYIDHNEKLTTNAAALTKVIEEKIESFHAAYNRVFLKKGEKKHRTPHAGFIYQFVKWTAIPAILLLRRKIIPQTETAALYKYSQKGLLVIANHTWWIDAPILYFLLWRRSMRCIGAKDNVEKSKGQEFMLKAMSCILLDRNGYDFLSLKESINELKDGGGIIIFPEGHLGYTEEMSAFTPGASMLSLMSDTPVWPVYISSPYKPFSKLIFAVGDAIAPCDVPGQGINNDRVATFTAMLENKMNELKALADENLSMKDKQLLNNTRERRQIWMKETYNKRHD